MINNFSNVRYNSVIAKFLTESEQIFVIILNEEFIIKDCNPAFVSLSGSLQNPVGENLKSFVLQDQSRIFLFKKTETYKRINLHFNFEGEDSIPADCHMFRLEDEYLIFGEKINYGDSKVLEKMTVLNNELANMSRELNRKNRSLKEAHSKIKVLSGIIPICMNCKEIRDDKGYWNQLEKFISEHSDATFSHGICPKCMKTMYPKFKDKGEKK